MKRKPLSPEAQAARYPVFTPEELVDARHEPVHVEMQGSRVPRVVRVVGSVNAAKVVNSRRPGADGVASIPQRP